MRPKSIVICQVCGKQHDLRDQTWTLRKSDLKPVCSTCGGETK